MGLLLSEISFIEKFWESFLEKLNIPFVLVALGFAVFGLAIAILARRLTRIHRGKNNIEDNDPVLITYKVISVVSMSVSVLIFIFI